MIWGYPHFRTHPYITKRCMGNIKPFIFVCFMCNLFKHDAQGFLQKLGYPRYPLTKNSSWTGVRLSDKPGELGAFRDDPTGRICMDLNLSRRIPKPWKPPRQRQVAAAPAGLTHLGMPRWGPSLRRRFLCLNNSSWTLFWYMDNPTTSSTMELVAESPHFGIAWLIDCQFRFSESVSTVTQSKWVAESHGSTATGESMGKIREDVLFSEGPLSKAK